MPIKVRWLTVYVYDPVEMYYRLSSYLHYRYSKVSQTSLRAALVKRKNWPKSFAKQIPQSSLIGIFVAFRLNQIFSRWNMSLIIEESAKAAFKGIRVF